MNTKQALDGFLASEEVKAFRMAQISTNSSDEALDILQDAMIKFVEKYSQKPRIEWKPLFYRVLNSHIIDWHRRRKVRSGLLSFFTSQQQLDSVSSDSPEPLQQLGAEHAITSLESALRKLPLRQQQAVLHRLWDGLDTRETAIAMGVSTGSVKTHYSRALKALQKELGEHWP